jgi:hypothetical protein
MIFVKYDILKNNKYFLQAKINRYFLDQGHNQQTHNVYIR